MRKLSQGEGIAVWLAVVVVAGALLFGGKVLGMYGAAAPDDSIVDSTGTQPGNPDDVLNLPTAAPTDEPTAMPTSVSSTNTPSPTGMNKLMITDETVGTGAEAVAGKTVTVNYKGTFENGTTFDSSYDRGQPFSFVLGAGQVIQGWDQGFAGMKVGGKRKIVVPPDMGYGPNDYGPIPGNSTLIFEVELLDVK